MAFKLNIDTNNTGSGFGIVAEGKYNAQIIKAELKEFQGNHNIGFDVEISSHVEQPHKGARVLYNTLYLSSSNPDYAESTQQKVNAFFKALGCDTNGEIDVDDVLSKSVGTDIIVYIKHRTKDDKTFPYVNFVAEDKAAVKITENNNQITQQNTTTIKINEKDLPF